MYIADSAEQVYTWPPLNSSIRYQNTTQILPLKEHIPFIPCSHVQLSEATKDTLQQLGETKKIDSKIQDNNEVYIMSMRGELISKEYQRMVFVDDVDGKEYVCYKEDLTHFDSQEGLSQKEKEKCMDLSLVLGDSW